jgi:hypothetical protein
VLRHDLLLCRAVVMLSFDQRVVISITMVGRGGSISAASTPALTTGWSDREDPGVS